MKKAAHLTSAGGACIGRAGDGLFHRELDIRVKFDSIDPGLPPGVLVLADRTCEQILTSFLHIPTHQHHIAGRYSASAPTPGEPLF